MQTNKTQFRRKRHLEDEDPDELYYYGSESDSDYYGSDEEDPDAYYGHPEFINPDIRPLNIHYKKDAQADLTWIPGHPHVGPGNPIYPWSNTNMDNIARDHDIEYSVAKTPWDVYQADEKFMERAGKLDPESTSEWWAKQIGKLGINAKYSFEKRYGIAYPTFTEKQIAEFRKNPRFVELEKQWQKNMTRDVSGIGLKVHSFMKPKLIPTEGFISPKYPKKIGYFIWDKMVGKQNTFTGNLDNTSGFQWWQTLEENKNNQWDKANIGKADKFVQDFFDYYHENVITPKLKEYVKQNPNNIQDFKNWYYYNFELDNEKHWQLEWINKQRIEGKPVRATPGLEHLKDKYFAGYRDVISQEIQQIDDLRGFVSYQNLVNQYNSELHYLETKYGEKEIRQSLNQWQKGIAPIKKDLETLYHLFNKSKAAYDSLNKDYKQIQINDKHDLSENFEVWRDNSPIATDLTVNRETRAITTRGDNGEPMETDDATDNEETEVDETQRTPRKFSLLQCFSQYRGNYEY